MELKDIVITLSIILTAFVVIGIGYNEITTSTNLNSTTTLSTLSNTSDYEQKLDNTKDSAQNNYQNTSNIGSVDANAFDKLGALVEAGFDSADKGLDSVEQSSEMLTDIQNDTSSYVPAVIFTFLIGALFVLLTFGLIRMLIGR